MKITIKQTLEQEVEINLPHFRKFGDSFFKIETEKITTRMTDYPSGEIGIERSQYLIPSSFLPGSIEITESEFNEAFEKVRAKINSL